MKLVQIQSELKVPKNQFNSFGGYKYRSCEDIVEAVKPIIHKHGFYLILSDEVVLLGERYYVKATATLTNGTETFSTSAFAREDLERKKSDGSQLTGSASTYARKYALNGLFAIDDTKDADATHGEEIEEQSTQNGTTLYNHKEIKTNGKPLISNAQFKKACERVEKGELEVFANTIKTFSMTPEQLNLLTQKHNEQKQPA